MGTKILDLNGGVELAVGALATGDMVPVVDVSDTTEHASGTTKKYPLHAAFALKADYNAVRAESGNFTISAANHSNRSTYCSAAAVATFNTGHGMTAGDTGVFYQNSTGAVSIVAGTASVELSPNVTAAATTGIRGWLQWEYMGSDVLRITDAGVRIWRFTDVPASPTTHTGTTSETTFYTKSIPAGVFVAGRRMRMQATLATLNGATTSTYRLKFGGTTLFTPAVISNTFGTTIGITLDVLLYASGDAVQFVQAPGTDAATSFTNVGVRGSGALTTGAVDGTAAQDLILTAALGDTTASYSVALRAIQIEVT